MKKLSLFISLAAVAVVVGCSTPESRIGRSPESFNKLGAGDQQLIREGKVAVGFTPEMVRLALGEPDLVYTRTDANGENEAWSYTTYETEAGVMLYRGHYHRYACDPFYYPYYTSSASRRTREYLKGVFVGGVVSLIEKQT